MSVPTGCCTHAAATASSPTDCSASLGPLNPCTPPPHLGRHPSPSTPPRTIHFFASAEKAKRELDWKPRHDFLSDVDDLVYEYKMLVSHTRGGEGGGSRAVGVGRGAEQCGCRAAHQHHMLQPGPLWAVYVCTYVCACARTVCLCVRARARAVRRIAVFQQPGLWVSRQGWGGRESCAVVRVVGQGGQGRIGEGAISTCQVRVHALFQVPPSPPAGLHAVPCASPHSSRPQSVLDAPPASHPHRCRCRAARTRTSTFRSTTRSWPLSKAGSHDARLPAAGLSCIGGTLEARWNGMVCVV